MKNGDLVSTKIFGRIVYLPIYSVGDNHFDKLGNYKEGAFKLTTEEVSLLDWFLRNVNISDYIPEICDWCNEQYGCISYNNPPVVSPKNIASEVQISSIMINVTKNVYKYEYPDIAFYGDCNCDIEHGICIGFKNGKFLGIKYQDWIL